jgi:hypothetical protein
MASGLLKSVASQELSSRSHRWRHKRRDYMIAERPDHAPGDAAPAAGIYEQLNIFGRPTGIRVNVEHGHPLPSAPVGHNWTLADDDRAEC